jgi:hypothetical protein
MDDTYIIPQKRKSRSPQAQHLGLDQRLLAGDLDRKGLSQA